MNIHATVGAPARVRSSKWLWVGAVVTAVAAVGVVLAVTSGSREQKAGSAAASKAPALVTSAARDARRVRPLMSLTPAQLAGGALGTSYVLSPTRTGPTTASSPPLDVSRDPALHPSCHGTHIRPARRWSSRISLSAGGEVSVASRC